MRTDEKTLWLNEFRAPAQRLSELGLQVKHLGSSEAAKSFTPFWGPAGGLHHQSVDLSTGDLDALLVKLEVAMEHCERQDVQVLPQDIGIFAIRVNFELSRLTRLAASVRRRVAESFLRDAGEEMTRTCGEVETVLGSLDELPRSNSRRLLIGQVRDLQDDLDKFHRQLRDRAYPHTAAREAEAAKGKRAQSAPASTEGTRITRTQTHTHARTYVRTPHAYILTLHVHTSTHMVRRSVRGTCRHHRPPQ